MTNASNAPSGMFFNEFNKILLISAAPRFGIFAFLKEMPLVVPPVGPNSMIFASLKPDESPMDRIRARELGKTC